VAWSSADAHLSRLNAEHAPIASEPARTSQLKAHEGIATKMIRRRSAQGHARWKLHQPQARAAQREQTRAACAWVRRGQERELGEAGAEPAAPGVALTGGDIVRIQPQRGVEPRQRVHLYPLRLGSHCVAFNLVAAHISSEGSSAGTFSRHNHPSEGEFQIRQLGFQLVPVLDLLGRCNTKPGENWVKSVRVTSAGRPSAVLDRAPWIGQFVEASRRRAKERQLSGEQQVELWLLAFCDVDEGLARGEHPLGLAGARARPAGGLRSLGWLARLRQVIRIRASGVADDHRRDVSRRRGGVR
jgi:hypothetical protein